MGIWERLTGQNPRNFDVVSNGDVENRVALTGKTKLRRVTIKVDAEQLGMIDGAIMELRNEGARRASGKEDTITMLATALAYGMERNGDPGRGDPRTERTLQELGFIANPDRGGMVFPRANIHPEAAMYLIAMEAGRSVHGRMWSEVVILESGKQRTEMLLMHRKRSGGIEEIFAYNPLAFEPGNGIAEASPDINQFITSRQLLCVPQPTEAERTANAKDATQGVRILQVLLQIT